MSLKDLVIRDILRFNKDNVLKPVLNNLQIEFNFDYPVEELLQLSDEQLFNILSQCNNKIINRYRRVVDSFLLELNHNKLGYLYGESKKDLDKFKNQKLKNKYNEVIKDAKI